MKQKQADAQDDVLNALIMKILEEHKGSEGDNFSQMDVVRISWEHLKHTPVMNLLCFTVELLLASCEPAMAQAIKMIMDAAFLGSSDSEVRHQICLVRLITLVLFLVCVSFCVGSCREKCTTASPDHGSCFLWCSANHQIADDLVIWRLIPAHRRDQCHEDPKADVHQAHEHGHKLLPHKLPSFNQHRVQF